MAYSYNMHDDETCEVTESPVRKDAIAAQDWQRAVVNVSELKERMRDTERRMKTVRESLQKAIAEEEELFQKLQEYRPEENRFNKLPQRGSH